LNSWIKLIFKGASSRNFLFGVFTSGVVLLAGCSSQINRLSGFHSAVGFATLTRNPNYIDFGDVTIHTTTASQDITITNELVGGLGAGPITCSTPTLSNALDFVLGASTCGVSVAPGASCTIGIAASPASAAVLDGNVSISCRDATGVSQTVTAQVHVNGVQIILAVNPLTSDFGSVQVGSNSTTTDFTFSNSGNQSATGCTAAAISNTTDFSMVAQTCGTNDLVAGGSCIASVRANPGSTGAHSTTLTRTCAVGGSISTTTNLIVVNGVSPSLAWTPLTYDFGSVNVGSNGTAHTFTFANTGGAAATGCSAPSLSNTTDFTVTADGCGTTSTPATTGTCTVSIRANPASSGARIATLSRSCTYGGTASTTANQITVTGITANLAWTPLTKDFGNIDVGSNSTAQTFTLTNSGGAAATGCTAPSLSDSTNFSFTVDNCGIANLAGSNTTCTVSVRANPTAQGSQATTLSRTCTFGGTATTTSNQIVTNGQQVNLAFDILTHSYGTVNSGSVSANQTYTLSNSGNKTASGCSAPSLSNATDFEIVSETCGTTNVVAAGSCTVTVRAIPQSTGSKTTTLSRTCTVGGTASTTTNGLTTNSVAPTLAWTPLVNAFGNIDVGTNSTTQAFTLSNTGAAAATGCSAPSISDTTNFTITADGCATSNVAATTGTCTVTVRANPTTSGAKSATLSRVCTFGGTPTTTTNGITVTGVTPSLAWAPLTKDFGNVNVGSNSSTQTFTLTNSGATTATGCSAPTISDTTDFTINTDNCGAANLAGSGTSCTVVVQGNPTTSGAKAATLSRTCTFGGTAATTTNQIVVTGTSPSLAWTPLTTDFGNTNVGANSSTATFTLTNAGTATATGCAAPSVTDTTNFTIVTDNCGTATLAGASATCTVIVRGNPTTLGAKSTTLSRACTFGGSAATTTNGIVVTGVSPSLAWTPLTNDFGSVNVGANSTTQTFTLTNSGGATATGCSIPSITDTTNFTITTDNCGTSNLAGATTCTVIVRGNPTTTGAKTATLSRVCTYGGSPATTTGGVVVTGIAASLAWSPLTNDFGTIGVGAHSSNQTFTLTNSGAATATGCSAPSLSNSTDFSVQTDNCTTANLAGSAATCTVLVRSNPASNGAKTTTLSRTCTFGGTAATTTNQIITTGYTPTVAFLLPAAGSYATPSNKTAFPISGSCSENGQNVVISGAGSATVACASLAWSTTVNVSAAPDGAFTLYADHANGSGSSAAQASRAFVKDTTAPVFTAAQFTLNGGVNPALTNFVPVTFIVADPETPVTAYCLKYNSTTTPTAGDACWVSISPTNSYSASVNFRLGFPSAVYSVYGWAKNAAGLISTLTNAGAGTSGQDFQAITFSPVAPPVLSGVTASSVDGSVNLTITSGSDVYVKWTASSAGTLTANPISIYYTTDDSNYTVVNASLANAQGSGCTTAGAETGCYKWTGGSPTSSYYRIRVGAIDTNGRQSFQSSQPLNVATTLQIIAGTTDSGTGGSANAAIFMTQNLNQGWNDPQSVAVTTSGVVYFNDWIRGILKVDPADGIQKLIFPKTASIVEGAVGTATVRNVQRIVLDSQNRLVIQDDDRIRRYDPVAGTIATIIGGGGSSASPVAPLSLNIYSGYWNEVPLFLAATPDGKIYFQSDSYASNLNAGYGLRVYDPGTNLVTKMSFTGTGDAYSGTQDISQCSSNSLGLTFDPVTGALINIIAQLYHQGGLCPGTGANYPFTILDPATLMPSGTFPANNPYSDSITVGNDGSAFMVDRISAQLSKYNNSTHLWTTILGTGNPGVCADGTLATACATDILDATADANGKIYFVERGKIRTIDQAGNVYTVMGSGFTSGDGGTATSARIGSITDVKVWNNGGNDKIVLTDNSEFRFREFQIGGNIATVAGNGSQGHPNKTTAASGQSISFDDNASIDTLTIQVDPTAGTIYSSGRLSNRISKIDRSTGKWVDIVGNGTNAFNTAAADGKVGSQISLPGYSAELWGFDGTSLIAQVYLYNSDSMIKAYTVANGTQSPVAGVIGYSGYSYSADGTAGSATTVPQSQEAVQSGTWDSFSSKFIFASTPTSLKTIRSIGYTGNISTIATLPNVPLSIAYRHDASNNIVYYCSSGRIYKYNITTTTNTALTWPITRMSCSGRTMVYTSRGTLIFPFTQDGLGGVAEYANP
jgi:hypothetical protein